VENKKQKLTSGVLERSPKLHKQIKLKSSVKTYEEEYGAASTIEDQSFLEILKGFANLDFESKDAEKCPICPEKILPKDFERHVLECIKQLDGVEKEHQLKEDAKLAQSLGLGQIQEYSFIAGSQCPDGAECRRFDAQHFKNRWHPNVPCPICQEMSTPYEIDAHVSLCINSSSSKSPFAVNSTVTQTDNKMSDRVTNQQIAVLAKSVLEKSSSSDVSLLDMLDTFKSLGLTKSKMEERLKQATS